MDNIPLNLIAFGFVDRFLEPFCYGCAAYVVSFRLTKSSFAKIIAIVAGILIFLWMDDIWPKLGFQQGHVGIASDNPDVANLFAATTRQELGTARFNTGESSGLFGLYNLNYMDILSAILFVPLGFLMGLKLSRRKWDEVQPQMASNRYQPQRSIEASLCVMQPNQESSSQKGDSPMRIHIRPQNQDEQILSLEQVNAMLNQGELDGDEPAWAPGLSEWTRLDSINGVVLPKPPPFTEQKSPEAPPPFTEEILDSSPGNAVSELTKQPQTQNIAGQKGVKGKGRIATVKCPNCGKIIEEQTNCCEKCGVTFRKNEIFSIKRLLLGLAIWFTITMLIQIVTIFLFGKPFYGGGQWGVIFLLPVFLSTIWFSRYLVKKFIKPSYKLEPLLTKKEEQSMQDAYEKLTKGHNRNTKP